MYCLYLYKIFQLNFLAHTSVLTLNQELLQQTTLLYVAQDEQLGINVKQWIENLYIHGFVLYKQLDRQSMMAFLVVLGLW